jgi:Fis family transcriptional regulator
MNVVKSTAEPDSTMCLSGHVKQALELYFNQLAGYETADLYNLVMREVEKPLLETALAQCDYNQTKTAKILGLSRSTLRKKLELYDLF